MNIQSGFEYSVGKGGWPEGSRIVRSITSQNLEVGILCTMKFDHSANPMSDPFKSWDAFNPKAPEDIFTKPNPKAGAKGRMGGVGGGGGGSRARQPEPEPELEPLDIPVEPIAPAPEKPEPSVTLRNPKWEIEKVGFNENTDISIEVDLPEKIAHRTKITFELFAKTPDGPCRIVQGEAHAKEGKALCCIPVYIPSYKDAKGNRLQKVDYYFTAKHTESALLDGSKKTKLVDEMAERLIETHIVPNQIFASGKSFLHPKYATELKDMCAKIKVWRDKHPDEKLAVFGHTNTVGKDVSNKALSERNAKSVHGFLMKDASVWCELDKEEKWGLSEVQELLNHLGHDAGASDGHDGPKTQAAVKAFQTKQGLLVDGQAGANTREVLYQAFMEDCNTLNLKAKAFDSINGHPTAGCSEFNLVEKSDGASEANHRVAVLFVKSNKNFPIHYPCAKGDVGACKSQVAQEGHRRTAGFGCKFYDELVKEKPTHGGKSADKPKDEIIHVGIFFDGTDNNRDRDRPLKHDTNVSKLFDLYQQDDKSRYKFYLEGVGTGNWLKSDKFSGGFSGRGIYDRIVRATKSLKDVTDKHPESEIRLSVFGFSRGAATALAFINYLFDKGATTPVQSSASAGSNISFGLPSQPTHSTTPEENAKKLGFEKVWFVGLFDTVASVGMPGDDKEYTHDVSVKHSKIRRLTHYVARDERRGLFPSTSIHTGSGSALPSGWEEKIFPGAHSDVGGGYEEQLEDMANASHDQGQDHTKVVNHTKKGDHLSRVAGWAMYDAALKADVPMYGINFDSPTSSPAQHAFDNIMMGKTVEEIPENGWTTFKLPDGTENSHEKTKDALKLLSIPFHLGPLWKSRNSESTFNGLVSIHDPDFKDNIYPYIHDSLGLMDPKGIGESVGINASPRTTIYRGVPK